MFNLTGSELVVILLIALVVLGPEKLPEAIRRVGRIYAELRKMSSGFQEEFTSAIREPLDEVRSTTQMVTKSLDFTAEAPTDERPPDKSEGESTGDPAAPGADPPSPEPPARGDDTSTSGTVRADQDVPAGVDDASNSLSADQQGGER